jgi:CDGSH-type Zn-finger protein/ferredoxin
MKSKLTPLTNGPLQLTTDKRIIVKDGVPLQVDGTVLLCTCGRSGSKPICDFTHVSVDFSSEREIDEEILQEYPGQEITVYFNRSICSGAGACVRGLPSVFKSGDSSNWIFPDEDTADRIIERVKACPSGALSYRIGDGDVVVEEGAQEQITVVKDGPYNVEGVALDSPHAPTHGSASKYALCRCGFSQNKPFCDYSHAEKGWRDGDDQDAAATTGPDETAAADDGPVVADNKPALVQLKSGEGQAFCTCGRSQGQPFCDGSHAGTSFSPLLFSVDEDEGAALCQCKASANLPYCDGSHAQIPDSEIGKPR